MCVFSILAFMACSESPSTNTESETQQVTDETEYPNWKATNETYFEDAYQTALTKSMEDPEHWKLVKAYTKEKDPAGKLTDYKQMQEAKHTEYVLMQVLEASGNPSLPTPEFTDSVRLYYKGWLAPSTSHKYEKYGAKIGYCFEATYFTEVVDASKSLPKVLSAGGNNIVGFSTALQHMRPGDHCLVTIPYELAYGKKAKGSVPAYSALVFEITMHSFTKAGKPFPIIQ